MKRLTRLNLDRQPRWIEIDAELKVLARPLSRPECAEILAPLLEPPHGAVFEAMQAGRPVEASAQLAFAPRAEAAVQAAVAAAVTDWTVQDDDGARLPVTPAVVTALLDAEPALGGALLRALVGERLAALRDLDAEKNGSAPSPNGTSAGAETTARPATASARSARQR
jgi:hypothetical protein